MIRTLAATGLAAFLAFPASAQTPDFSGLDGLRDQNRQLYEGRGYAHAAGPFYMTLNEEGRQSVQLPVAKGVEYIVVGVCDSNCSDLDLILRASTFMRLGSDEMAGKSPVVEHRATIDDVMTIEGVMGQCWATLCNAAFDVFSKR